VGQQSVVPHVEVNHASPLLARCTRWCILHLMRWVQSFALCETLSTDHIHRHVVVLVSAWALQTASHNERTQVSWPVRAVP
jgi:hypothetical protein